MYGANSHQHMSYAGKFQRTEKSYLDQEYNFGIKMAPIMVLCFNRTSCWDDKTESPVKDYHIIWAIYKDAENNFALKVPFGVGSRI